MDFTDRLRRDEWTVGDVPIAIGRTLVEQHHYARGAANTRTALHGLYNVATGALHGVAWWIPPTRTAANATWPEDWKAVLALSRLVIVPNTPKNAATFLLARSVKMLADCWRCCVTYADTWRGHTGGIYRAAGWEYVGMTKPERVYVIDGRMTARKAGGKTRTHAEMVALGAECVGAFPRHKFRFVRTVER